MEKPTKAPKFSASQYAKLLDIQVANRIITRAEANKQLAMMKSKGALTDGSRARDEVVIEATSRAMGVIRKAKIDGKREGTACYKNRATGKMVIIYVTTAKEGSAKFKALAKGQYANDVRLARSKAKTQKRPARK